MKPVLVLFVLAFGLVCAVPLGASAQPAAAPKPPAPLPPRNLAPELWRGARIGMSPDEISARFPTAKPSSGETLPGGDKSALGLAVQLGGGPATAQFYFNTDGLDQVTIDRPDVAAHKTDENLAKAHRVADQLASDYGKPGQCAEQPHIAALTCTWALGEAKAMLSYRDIGGASPTLNVSFRKLKDAKPWSPGPVKKLKPR